MMQVSLPISQAAAPAAPAAPNAHKPADAPKAPFANLLRQSQSVQQARPASAEPDTAAPDDAPAAPESAARPRPKPADKTSAPRAAERNSKVSAPEETRPDTAAAEAKTAKRSDMPAAEPALPPWLPALQPPTDMVLPAGARAAADSGKPGIATAASTDPTPPTQADKTADDKRTRLDPSAASTANAALSVAATRTDGAALQRPGEHFREELRSAGSIPTDATPSPAALGAAAFNPLLGGARESAPALAVNLPTPLASPEFAQALGVQMSVLATDGVQHAELQLNPPEMGPVSVQIVIDGSSAHVDFGADLAATRQAIEAGLPELAGALRDAGFTLTGGGVSQHSAGRRGSQESGRDHGGSGADARRGAEAPAATTATRTHRSVAAGGVDLYA